jgi:hypothetical protein
MIATFIAFMRRHFTVAQSLPPDASPQPMGMYASTYLHRSDWNPR